MDVYSIAEARHGVVSRDELRRGGFSEGRIEHWLRTNRIERLYPGVYRLSGSVPTVRQRWAAAALSTRGHLSHATAAVLLQLDRITTNDVHIVVAPGSSRGRNSDLVMHRSDVPSYDRRIVDGIACVSAARAIVDCAALVDDETLECAYESARRLGLATRNGVLRALATRGGSAKLRRILDADERAKASRLEVRLARLLRKSSLPAPVWQHRIGRYRVDAAWPDRALAVEADGFEHHGFRLSWKRDRRRIAEIEALGWRIVHLTWDDVVAHPHQTLDRIALSLGTMAA